MTHRTVLLFVASLLAATLLLTTGPAAQAQNEKERFVSPVDSLTDDIEAAVEITGDFEETLSSDSTDVHLILGKANLTQGGLQVSGAKLAVFVTQTESGFEISAYGEDVNVQTPDGQRPMASLAFRLETLAQPVFRISRSIPATSNDHPLLRRSISRLFPVEAGQASTVSFQAEQDSFSVPVPSFSPSVAIKASRTVQIRPRSSDPLRFESFTSEGVVPEERVTVITGGVNVLIDGQSVDIMGQEISPGVIDLSADRVVIWTQSSDGDALKSGNQIIQTADTSFQVYLEGNIVIRQNQNTIKATRAFFDAQNNRALMLNAELRAFVPVTGDDVRIRGERIMQLSRDRFHAKNAWATTSPYGKPGYRVQASDIFVEPGDRAFVKTDPETGQQVVGQSTWITGLNNQFIVGDIPLFYLPRISGPAEDPGIPLRSVGASSDRIFGVQLNTVWDMNRLLGIRKQPGLQWDLLGDYRTKRGPGVGTKATYSGSNGLGDYQGDGKLYYQYDQGTDNLGRDRRRLEPDSESRGEVIWRHRQDLPADGLIFGEIGYLSDRNFLEQYHEDQFDTDKDVETVLGARQDFGAYSGSLWGRADLSGFEANTQWLPRVDAYSFSQSLFNGLLYWSSHSSAGYADMQQMSAPGSLADPYTPQGLPYVSNVNGLVTMTRHELDMPFNVGPVNFEPFVMGEAAYWQQNLTAMGVAPQSVDRYLVNAGVRARLTASKIYPFVRSDIFNLNGLAHKHDTMLEYSVTNSSTGIGEIPQYNEIDENSQERFRSRYTLQVFPGVIPSEFNPRNYAIRTGAGLWTSAPYHELADDFQALRIGFRDRLQTKSGPANAQRIRDWMVWEYGASFFPKSDRDNFGEDFGLLYSHYRWNISDRTSILTDASWDLFDNAQNIWSVGLLSQRSLRGSVYLGYRDVTATNYFESRTVIGSYSYQMSPKWISTASAAFDVAAGEARGTSLTVSRVGLDWILHFGLGFDYSKDNVGIGVSLEPRFGSPNATNLSYLLGLQN